MRCYEVTVKNSETKPAVQFAPNEPEARKIRNEMMIEFELPKKAITIQGVEVPTKKDELIPWLNTRLDELGVGMK